MVGLTATQKVDVNFAILEYMMKNNYDESAKIFAQQATVDYEGYLKASTSPPSLLKDILERKWTSIARLKKQVMELEKQWNTSQQTLLIQRCKLYNRRNAKLLILQGFQIVRQAEINHKCCKDVVKTDLPLVKYCSYKVFYNTNKEWEQS